MLVLRKSEGGGQAHRREVVKLKRRRLVNLVGVCIFINGQSLKLNANDQVWQAGGDLKELSFPRGRMVERKRNCP